jgi:3-dehydroquinate dehydratase/shikimate dehydrogenase
VIGLGIVGLPTRLLASWYGSRWSYAGDGVAPGQIPATRMLEEFRFRDAAGATRYGIVGNNVVHSLSPAMHNAALEAAGEHAVYVPVPARDFNDFRAFARGVGLTGASVTIPFKIDALHAAAESDGAAREIGAANTLDCRSTAWRATNTDAAGFIEPLASAFAGQLRSARVAVLGAGGAARAVVYALREAGASVCVHARRPEASRVLAGEFSVASGVWPPKGGSWDLLVNTTPLGGGSDPDRSPMPDGPFDGRLVYDLTYRRGRSLLLRDAQAAGCQVLDGLPMLVAQAERQFAWWLGRRPVPGVMQAAAEASLGS